MSAHTDGPADPFTPLPIPLATGETFPSTDGTPTRITSAQITLTLADGTTATVPLTYEDGGWRTSAT